MLRSLETPFSETSPNHFSLPLILLLSPAANVCAREWRNVLIMTSQTFRWKHYKLFRQSCGWCERRNCDPAETSLKFQPTRLQKLCRCCCHTRDKQKRSRCRRLFTFVAICVVLLLLRSRCVHHGD